MKTLIKKLKFGILLTGFAILVSCSNIPMVSTVGIHAINRTIPSMAITATKYTGNKISNFLMNPSATKSRKESTVKKNEKTNRRLRAAMPISIGVTGEARLISSQPLSK